MPRTALAALLVVVGGAALRAHDVEGALVWHDEVFTQVFAAGKGGADWLPLFDGQVRPITELRRARERDPERTLLDTAAGLAADEPQHPPLYYLGARLFGGLVDTPDVTLAAKRLRWLTFALSLLVLLAAGWCARELYQDPLRRLAAWALFACSPFHVLYAQEAREYALWTALVLASSAALLRARRLGTVGGHALYAILLALGFYVSLATAAVGLGHAIFVLARDLPRRAERGARRSPAQHLAARALALGLFAPWTLLLLRHWEAYRASMAWSHQIVVPRAQILDTFALNLARPFVELGADSIVGPMALVLGLVLPLAAVGLRRLTSEARWLLAGLVIAPLLLLLLPDLLSGGIRSLSARYLVPMLVALQLLVAAAVPVGPGRRAWLGRAVVVLLIVAGAATAVWAGQLRAPWTKEISRGLPRVAEVLRAHPDALLVGDHERHHPGTLLTLSGMVPGTIDVQLLGTVEGYALPEREGPFFFLDPNPRFRAELGESAGVRWERVASDEHAPLWRARASRSM